MISLLVVGGTAEERAKKAEEIIGFKIEETVNDPDFLFLSSAAIGIDEIRNLQKFLLLKPFRKNRKTVLVNEAQNLTIEAQNALLKTLEEPPKDSLIVLAAPNPDLLLPTIISRCEEVSLPLSAQVNLSDQELSESLSFFKKLATSSIGERFNLLEDKKVYQDRQSALDWLNELTLAVRFLLLSDYHPAKKSLFLPFSSCQYLALLNAINAAKIYLRANCNLRLTIESFLSLIPLGIGA